MRWASRIGVVALVGGLAAVTVQPKIASLNVADTGELVVNGGFENGTTGWRVNDSSTSSLSVGTPGHSGNSTGTLLALRNGVIALNDVTNTVASTKAGTTYTVSAWMRSTAPRLIAQLRIREVNAGKLVKTGGKAARLTTSWQQVAMEYTTQSAGAKLDLNVVGWGIPAGYGIQIDDISMRSLEPVASPPVASPSPTLAPPTTSPTPSETTSEPPAPPTSSSSSTSPGGGSGTTPGGAAGLLNGRLIPNCISARGIPSCGSFMGAAVGGNADPASQEAKYGKLALRRTYFQSSQVSSAVKTAKADLAAGRIPWLSFKEPYSWSDMVAGKGDAWAADLAQQLSQLNGPVWLAIHHEPEKDGDIKEWTMMQAHLAPIIRSIAPNVAYSIILTGWQDVFGSDPSYKLANEWPGDGLIDIVAFDAYNLYGQVKDGKTLTKFTEMKEYYTPLAAFAKQHHVAWAIGESGYQNAASAKDPSWLTRAMSDLESMGGAGYAYFDSGLNSPYGSWTIDTPAEYAAFQAALGGALRMS